MEITTRLIQRSTLALTKHIIISPAEKKCAENGLTSGLWNSNVRIVWEIGEHIFFMNYRL